MVTKEKEKTWLYGGYGHLMQVECFHVHVHTPYR